jgi:hypothetical protein
MSDRQAPAPFFVTSDADLRQVNAATVGGFVGTVVNVCSECGKDQPTLPNGLQADRCECGCGYWSARPPSETLFAQVGGGIRAVKRMVRPEPPKPTPLAEDLAPAVWLADSLRGVLEALAASDEALRRLMAQGPTSERRWSRAQAEVHAATATIGDFGAILGQPAPVRQQLERLRVVLATAVDDPDELRRRSRIESVLAENGHNDPHMVAAVMMATSEDGVTAPVDLAVVADLIGRLDAALGALPEAAQALDHLAKQDRDRWDYSHRVVRHIAEYAGDARTDRLGLELHAVVGLLDQQLREVLP